jgi:hypothetical protein
MIIKVLLYIINNGNVRVLVLGLWSYVIRRSILCLEEYVDDIIVSICICIRNDNHNV